ncbi:hypothetical protein ACIG47_18970 [Promicromonospora sp. NPDC052451]|uniref:hypothetical protein n=1 Tax=Promicromonospora sp. NPDC052451 TaxID=3364407 RepID=UPI0037CA86EF
MLQVSDPVADAIGLLRPRTVVCPALRAGGVWGVRFEAFPHVTIEAGAGRA